MWLFLAIILIFVSLSEQQPYTLEFRRVGDVIILQCKDNNTNQLLQVSTDSTVRFWVNRTEGIRPAGFEPDLGERTEVGLIRGDRDATFLLTPDLEGYFSCGIQPMSGPVVESRPILLICK